MKRSLLIRSLLVALEFAQLAKQKESTNVENGPTQEAPN